jgi:tetratricopeptide (TPR) repeat protein
MDDEVDEIEKVLSEANRGNVSLIGEGLTKQHFIELDYESEDRGPLFEYHINNNSWLSSFASDSNETTISVDELGRKRHSIIVDGQIIFQTELDDAMLLKLKRKMSRMPEEPSYGYFFDKGDRIRKNLVHKADEYYGKALELYKEQEYEKAIERLNKAFCLQPMSVKYHLLKLDCFIQIVDLKSALLTINKVLSLLTVTGGTELESGMSESLEERGSEDVDGEMERIRVRMNEKTVLCHYLLGQVYYDTKLYYDALEAFNKASEMRPSSLPFKMRR